MLCMWRRRPFPDEDRKQHLEKEAHDQLHDDETPEDIEIAKKQEELNESHPHHI